MSDHQLQPSPKENTQLKSNTQTAANEGASMSPPTFQLRASGSPIQMQEADPGDWIKDIEGGKAMYYKTKAEAEKRMGNLKALGKYSSYRVSPYTNSHGDFWRVEMRNGSDSSDSGDWEPDLEGGKAMYYKTKDRAERRMEDLKERNASSSYRVKQFTNSQGVYWRVETKAGSAAPVKTEPVKTSPAKVNPPADTSGSWERDVEDGKAMYYKTKGEAEKRMGNLKAANSSGTYRVRQTTNSMGKFWRVETQTAGSSKTEPVKTSPAKTEPAKVDPVKIAPVKEGSGKTEEPSSDKTAKGTGITVKLIEAPASFATAMAGKTFNSGTTVDNVNLKTMIAIQDRIKQIRSASMGSKFSNAKLKAIKDKTEFTAADKVLIKKHIALTLTGIKSIQSNKKINWWAKKKHNDRSSEYVLTKSKTKPAYKYGQLADKDATFIFLNEYKKQTISWKEGKGTKSRTRHNFVKSGHNSYTEGISDSGTLKPGDTPVDRFKTAGGLDDSQAKALKHASQHEGKYDGINTFDRAVLSYGFIQFAGGNRSLEYLFARIKANHPDVWKTNFSQYGIDVEYKTNSKGAVNKKSCIVVVTDPADGKVYRGMPAEHAIKNSPELIGVLMRAASNTDVQDEQIGVASDKYAKRSERATLKDFKMSVMLIKNAKGERVDFKVNLTNTVYVIRKGKTKKVTITPKKEITDYKKTKAYTTANAAKLVTETDLTTVLNKLTLGSIMQSEKEKGALYGVYINSPGLAISAFGSAIVAIIEEDELTTAAQIKAIGVDKLLRKAEALAIKSNHKDRIKTARTDKGLKS